MRLPALFFLFFILSQACTFAASTLSPESQKIILKADQLREQQKHQEAIILLEQANRNDPEQAAILYRLAEQYAASVAYIISKDGRIKLTEIAIDHAQRAIKADPKSGEAHLALAVSYGRLAENLPPRKQLTYSELIKSEAEEAARLNPKLDYAWHIQGRWHYEMATLNPVLRTFARILQGKLPPASLKTSIKCFKKAVALAPRRIQHHVELGRAYLAAENRKEAKKEFELALRLKAKNKDELQAQKTARTTLSKMK
ncbi:MAG: hypothetical protein ACK5NG_00955 [Chthoniobacterales bacterium]